MKVARDIKMTKSVSVTLARTRHEMQWWVLLEVESIQRLVYVRKVAIRSAFQYGNLIRCVLHVFHIIYPWTWPLLLKLLSVHSKKT